MSLDEISVPGESNGVVIVIDGRIAGAELFDKAKTLAKVWRKLIRSYAIDALEKRSEEGLAPDSVLKWLQRARDSKTEVHKSPGLGQDVRIEGEQAYGATLVVEDKPVHLELFEGKSGQ